MTIDEKIKLLESRIAETNKLLAEMKKEKENEEKKSTKSVLAEYWNCLSKLVIADRFYPSSKTCSKCGNIKKDLKLSDRTYHCNCCGLTINRDFNASLNLAKYFV